MADGIDGGGGGGGGRVRKWVVSSQALISMVMVQVFATGMLLLSKLVLINGTFVFALMAYRHLVAALCVAPFAFFFERDIRKRVGWWVFFWLFVNALTGITMAMGLYYYGLKDTTATYAANCLNLIPIITFAFSTIAGVEKVGVKSRAGKVKTMGALLCVAGALTCGLYEGKAFHIIRRTTHLHQDHDHDHDHQLKFSKLHWARGSFFLIASCFSYSTWYILQVKLMKVLPLKYWATMLTCIIAAAQSVGIGLCLDRSKAAWKLGSNLQLLTIFYSGGLATAATFCLISWTVAKRGPTYPSMFNPLSLIFVAILEAILLAAPITVGTLVGMSMIIIGLYSFLWGKRKEMKSKSSTLQPQPGVESMEVQVAVAPVVLDHHHLECKEPLPQSSFAPTHDILDDKY